MTKKLKKMFLCVTTSLLLMSPFLSTLSCSVQSDYDDSVLPPYENPKDRWIETKLNYLVENQKLDLSLEQFNTTYLDDKAIINSFIKDISFSTFPFLDQEQKVNLFSHLFNLEINKTQTKISIKIRQVKTDFTNPNSLKMYKLINKNNLNTFEIELKISQPIKPKPEVIESKLNYLVENQKLDLSLEQFNTTYLDDKAIINSFIKDISFSTFPFLDQEQKVNLFSHLFNLEINKTQTKISIKIRQVKSKFIDSINNQEYKLINNNKDFFELQLRIFQPPQFEPEIINTTLSYNATNQKLDLSLEEFEAKYANQKAIIKEFISSISFSSFPNLSTDQKADLFDYFFNLNLTKTNKEIIINIEQVKNSYFDSATNQEYKLINNSNNKNFILSLKTISNNLEDIRINVNFSVDEMYDLSNSLNINEFKNKYKNNKELFVKDFIKNISFSNNLNSLTTQESIKLFAYVFSFQYTATTDASCAILIQLENEIYLDKANNKKYIFNISNSTKKIFNISFKELIYPTSISYSVNDSYIEDMTYDQFMGKSSDPYLISKYIKNLNFSNFDNLKEEEKQKIFIKNFDKVFNLNLNRIDVKTIKITIKKIKDEFIDDASFKTYKVNLAPNLKTEFLITLSKEIVKEPIDVELSYAISNITSDLTIKEFKNKYDNKQDLFISDFIKNISYKLVTNQQQALKLATSLDIFKYVFEINYSLETNMLLKISINPQKNKSEYYDKANKQLYRFKRSAQSLASFNISLKEIIFDISLNYNVVDISSSLTAKEFKAKYQNNIDLFINDFIQNISFGAPLNSISQDQKISLFNYLFTLTNQNTNTLETTINITNTKQQFIDANTQQKYNLVLDNNLAKTFKIVFATEANFTYQLSDIKESLNLIQFMEKYNVKNNVVNSNKISNYFTNIFLNNICLTSNDFQTIIKQIFRINLINITEEKVELKTTLLNNPVFVYKGKKYKILNENSFLNKSLDIVLLPIKNKEFKIKMEIKNPGAIDLNTLKTIYDFELDKKAKNEKIAKLFILSIDKPEIFKFSNDELNKAFFSSSDIIVSKKDNNHLNIKVTFKQNKVIINNVSYTLLNTINQENVFVLKIKPIENIAPPTTNPTIPPNSVKPDIILNDNSLNKNELVYNISEEQILSAIDFKNKNNWSNIRYDISKNLDKGEIKIKIFTRWYPNPNSLYADKFQDTLIKDLTISGFKTMSTYDFMHERSFRIAVDSNLANKKGGAHDDIITDSVLYKNTTKGTAWILGAVDSNNDGTIDKAIFATNTHVAESVFSLNKKANEEKKVNQFYWNHNQNLKYNVKFAQNRNNKDINILNPKSVKVIRDYSHKNYTNNFNSLPNAPYNYPSRYQKIALDLTLFELEFDTQKDFNTLAFWKTRPNRFKMLNDFDLESATHRELSFNYDNNDDSINNYQSGFMGYPAEDTHAQKYDGATDNINSDKAVLYSSNNTVSDIKLSDFTQNGGKPVTDYYTSLTYDFYNDITNTTNYKRIPGGCSGSPVYDKNLNLVAIEHRGDNYRDQAIIFANNFSYHPDTNNTLQDGAIYEKLAPLKYNFLNSKNENSFSNILKKYLNTDIELISNINKNFR